MIALLCIYIGPANAESMVILVLGDSISSGHGIPQENRWANLMEQRLINQGYNYKVANASISGDTTSGGLHRLPDLLIRHKPSILLLELGGNDALRGMDPNSIQSNLAAITKKAQAENVKILLLGMRIPPNYGPVYSAAFEKIYRDLALQYNVPLVPFILEGVAAQAGMMQVDGIHPTAVAQKLILNNIWSRLKPLLTVPPGSQRASIESSNSKKLEE